jgi:hypothetical protein
MGTRPHLQPREERIVIWFGLRQVVAVVLMSLAGLEQPQNVAAADTPRYEVEVKLKVDTKNQALSATSLRLVEQRVRATARLGSGGVTILMLPDADDPEAQRLVVRGTTVPRLVERLVGTSGMIGWARALDASETAAIEAARVKGGTAKTKKTKYEETHGFPVPRWGASDPAFVRLEAGSDERAIQGGGGAGATTPTRTRETCCGSRWSRRGRTTARCWWPGWWCRPTTSPGARTWRCRCRSRPRSRRRCWVSSVTRR